MKILFWVSIGIIFYTYIGYPVAITVVAGVLRFFRKMGTVPSNCKRYPGDSPYFPSVSIIISVFNEEDVIEKKIESCLSIDYPKEKLEILVGSDGSTDRTNEILEERLRLLRRFAPRNDGFLDSRFRGNDSEGQETDGFRIIVNDVRRGKPATINRLVSEARGEILFFTDARQEIDGGALLKIVKNFQDKRIGCVSGELLYEKSSSITGRGVSAYWKYEKYLREKEADIHSMIGATGAIYACRRELFEELPEDIILDDVYTPLQIVKKGYRAIFDREAKAFDVVGETPRDEYRRKIRTLSGNYQIFFRMPGMLNPFKCKLALQIISHKLLRVAVPFFMLSLFLSNLFLVREPFYPVILVMQVSFYAIAILEALFRRKIKKIFGIPYLFCLMNFSAFVSFWVFIFNRSNVKWEKART